MCVLNISATPNADGGTFMIVRIDNRLAAYVRGKEVPISTGLQQARNNLEDHAIQTATSSPMEHDAHKQMDDTNASGMPMRITSREEKQRDTR